MEYLRAMFHPKLRRLCCLLRSTRCLMAILALLMLSYIYIRTYKPSRTISWPRPKPVSMIMGSSPSNASTSIQTKGPAILTKGDIAVLVISANRDQAIASHLEQLSQLRRAVDSSGIDRFPIIISQDGDTEAVTEVIKQFVTNNKNTFFIQVNIDHLTIYLPLA